MFNEPIIKKVNDIEIEYDIDDFEIVFSRNNIILKELTINVFVSPYYVGVFEIIIFDGEEEIAKIDFTGSFKDDTEAIMSQAERIAQKIIDKEINDKINLYLMEINSIANNNNVKITLKIIDYFTNLSKSDYFIFEDGKEIARIECTESKLKDFEEIRNKVKIFYNEEL